MSKLSENRAKIAKILADIEQLPEDRYYEGKEEGRAEGRAEGEAIGYENALSKRIELVVEENGNYEPQGESTGFKSVKVAVPERVPILQEKTATENGEVVADSGYDGLSKVTVNVGGSTGGDIDALIEGSITEVSSGVTKVGDNAFNSCKKLTTVNLPNVTKVGKGAFRDCTTLPSINLPSVTSIGESAFTNCSALAVANLPQVNNIGKYAFQACKDLKSADFPQATGIVDNTFNGCTSLESIIFQSAKSIGYSAFQNCSLLKTVNLPSATTIGNYSFGYCSALTSVDLPKATSIGSSAFQYCYVLKAVILRSETVCTLSSTNAFTQCYHILGTVNSTYNPTGAKDGYIYVPRALVDSYKAATNWSTYSAQFRALEDYTVDGTITGALDETKI